MKINTRGLQTTFAQFHVEALIDGEMMSLEQK